MIDTPIHSATKPSPLAVERKVSANLFALSLAALILAWLTLAPALRAAADDSTTPAVAPVPDADAQDKATHTVKQLFADDIAAAKTPAAKVDLARSLLQKGIDTQGDPAGQYVLFHMAKDLAIAAQDPAVSMQVIEEMARSFQIDGLAAKLETLTTLSKATLMPAQAKALVEATTAISEEAIAVDDFEVAKQALALGQIAAKRTRDGDFVKQLTARSKEVESLEAGYHDVKAAQALLDDKPLDPDANLAVGRYRALIKADWDGGIPMLALGSDQTLKELAIQELDDPDTGDDLLKLADQWWDYAATLDAATKDRVEARALVWYAKTLPQITGLEKLRVEKRLQEVSGKVYARIQLAQRTKKTAYSRTAGSNRGNGFIDMLDDGGLLIGFEIGTIDLGGEKFIRSIRPLYRAARGEPSGQNHGTVRGESVTIKAKEGFAVGALNVKATSHISGLSVTFMHTEGLGLNPRNSYTSDWVGGQGPATEIHLGGSGSPIIGLAGRVTNVIEALSLISLR